MERKLTVAYEIRTLSNLIRRRVLQMLPPPPEKMLTDMQRHVIDFLYSHQDSDVYQKDIEEWFFIRRSTASRLLKTLEEKEIITRTSVSHDARLKKLCLTPAALEKENEIREKITQAEKTIESGLTEEEIEQFIEIAEKMKKYLA